MVASALKPKGKYDLSKAKCFNCGGKSHMARIVLLEKTQKRKFIQTSLAWDSYEYGDDKDISNIDHNEYLCC